MSRFFTPARAAALTVAAIVVGASACSPGGGGGGGGGSAENFPDENIDIVVPFSAGGPTDTITRLVGEPMGDELGVQMVVQNVEGAGGTVGAGQVAADRPDGYSILMHHIGMSTAPALYDDLAYDPVKDFEPIGLVTELPMTIISRSDLPPTTLDELIAYLKDNKGVTFGNAGVGSASQLCGTLFKEATGTDFQEVPYDGSGPAIADLVGGQIDFMCDQTPNTMGQIEAGEVKAFAVTTPERLEMLPDLPTTAEAGLADFEISSWHALYAPAKTPKDVVEKLRAALESALADQGVIDQMGDLGTSPVPADQVNPEAVSTRLKEQIDQWSDVLS